MKKETNINKKSEHEKNDAKYAVAGIVLGAVALISVLAAVFLPIIKINADFNKIFDTMGAMHNPQIIITDMKADNVFAPVKGEVSVDDTSSALKIIGDITAIADGFEYDGRDETVGAWDLRVKVKDGEREATFYLSDGKISYVNKGVKYIFVASDDKTLEKYRDFYSEIASLVK